MIIETEHWKPLHDAVHREYLSRDGGGRQLGLVRHPTYPFRASIPDKAGQLFDELRKVARSYLARLQMVDTIPDVGDEPTGFGWLPISWDGPPGLKDPRGSFAVRRVSAQGDELDRTIVLVAARRVVTKRVDGNSDIKEVNGIEVGLRVVMHVGPAERKDHLRVRVTGLSASGLERANVALQPAPKVQVALAKRGLSPLDPLLYLQLNLQLIRIIFNLASATINGIERIATTLRLTGGGVGEGRARCDSGKRIYSWELKLVVSDGRMTRSTRSVEQVTDALAEPVASSKRENGRLFLRDPASAGELTTIQKRYATRGEELLKYYAHWALLPKTLEDPGKRFRVLQSVLADPKNCPNQPQEIDFEKLRLRTDHLAAGHAYQRASEFFQLMSEFDLSPEAYFKFAKLPLDMRHRACFDNHPDGRVANAQVRLNDEPLALSKEYKPDKRPQLEVCFGSAALRHRCLEPDDHDKWRPQFLGLAADPRWAWHEFGHVLSYAAGGALEFEFAHSAGDALAAVLNDPRSRLAKKPDAIQRGNTFPWVPTGRRHDRDIALGWGWCGRRNSQRHAPQVSPPMLHKGYIEEQMLSSSIFRLYRAIGGDTFAHPSRRWRAARYCAYLVVRAIALLGLSALVPARTPDAFVSALIDADIGTHPTSKVVYPGSCVHKVIRWAFERQGLFATDDPSEDAEGPGLPPPVDLWIKDQRLEDGGDGGYHPVPLDWVNSRWHAHKTSLWVEDGWIYVVVGNRGCEPAHSVHVKVWATASKVMNWKVVGDANAGTIAGGEEKQVKILLKVKLPKTYYLFAEATCEEDPSNLDPQTCLPCVSSAPPTTKDALMDIVACDNNLGFRGYG